MTDQAWALLFGLVMVVVLRLLDYYFPKGYISRRARRRSVLAEMDEDKKKTKSDDDDETGE